MKHSLAAFLLFSATMRSTISIRCLHGKLVRGSNWFDERFAMKYGKNKGGLQAKTFCDPDSAHCTLGFRYVIYLKEK